MNLVGFIIRKTKTTTVIGRTHQLLEALSMSQLNFDVYFVIREISQIATINFIFLFL